MNPARSLGPALFAGGGSIRILWLYIVAPVIGSVTAAGTYQWVRGRRETMKYVPEFRLEK
jgi:aquaporin Z